MIDDLSQDVRFGLRRSRRERGAVAAAVLTLGLTIGLATAVYSVARSIVLRPFPYARADRLVVVWKASPLIDFCPLPVPEALDIKARSSSVLDIGGFEREGFVILAPGGARWADTFAVTTNLLSLLGVRVVKGRHFLPEDGEPGHGNVVILGEPLWRDAFGADPNIVGHTVRLQAEGSALPEPAPYVVIGVVATELQTYYPSPLRAQMYVPRTSSAEDRTEEARSTPTLISIARLRDGVPVSAAASEIAAVLARSASEHPTVSLPFRSTRVLPLHEELVGRTRPAFLLLAGAAGLLLLIGCVNVANLVFVSVLGRRTEIATRLALGCSRGRLFRQLITEHLLLAALGAALGVLLAAWTTPMLRRLAPDSLPRAGDIQLDATALAAAGGLALFAWLSSGLLPAASLARARVSPRDGLGSRTMSRGNRTARCGLVVVQTLLVVTLLGAASLLARSMWRLTNAELGFRTGNVFVSVVAVPQQWWYSGDPRTRKLERALVDRLTADPRFAGVSMGSELPFTWGVLGGVKKAQSEKSLPALVAAVSDQYLRLLGVRLRSGRFLDARNDGDRTLVVINETLGRRLFAGDPVGQRLLIDGDWRQVVGVVGDVTEVGDLSGVIRRPGLHRITLPAAYVPLGSIDSTTHFLLARTGLDAGTAAAVVQKAVQAIEPTATIRKSGWLDERVAAAGAEARFCALVVGFFAAAALLLGAIGVYGVVANSVQERTLEMGIRAALGAAPRRLTWTIAQSVAAAVTAGGSLGFAVVLLGGRALRAFLFEVSPTDPWALTGVAVLLLVVAGLAAYLPIRTIVHLGPAHALRAD